MNPDFQGKLDQAFDGNLNVDDVDDALKRREHDMQKQHVQDKTNVTAAKTAANQLRNGMSHEETALDKLNKALEAIQLDDQDELNVDDLKI
jgi:hypothetical protein